MGRRWAGLTVLAVVAAALASAGGVGAAGGQDRVSGAGAVTLSSQQTQGAPEHDQFSVGATSDPDGSNPQGVVTDELSSPPGSPPTAFQGDVSQGCLIVHGNTAVAVGKLPESEQTVIPGFGTVDYLAVTVVDNGNPDMGQPTDQASAIFLFDRSAQRVCAQTLQLAVYPLDHGNFDVYDAS